MKSKTYKIIFADNQGSFAIDTLATSCEGTWRGAVQRYNGEHDLAIIDLPAENSDYLEQLLDADDNVISYQEVEV